MNSIRLKKELKRKWNDVISYFNVKGDLESQQDVEISIRSGVSFKGSQLLTLIFAIFIASLGLNTNSIPVIIGAMLISPLMGPIIGMGLGIAIQDLELVRRSFKNISAAVLGSLLTSALYFSISPLYDGASQLLARTSPSIYDVFVALFGGAAGILSIAAKNKGQVMPGVAIATSLMPPLCTAGYGLATFQMHFFLGALYLFFTNMIFIFFATWIGVKLMGYKKIVYQNEKRSKSIKAVAYSIIAVTIGVSLYLTVVMINNNIFLDKASHFVESQMTFPNTQVLNHHEYVKNGKRYIDVTLIGESLPKDSLKLAMITKLDSIGLGGTILNIKQGFSLNRQEISETQDDRLYQVMQDEIDRKQDLVDSLKYVLAGKNQFSKGAEEIVPEMKVIFPTVQNFALSSVVILSADNSRKDTTNIVFVDAPKGMTKQEVAKLREYIEVRLKTSKVNVSLNPQGFPWS